MAIGWLAVLKSVPWSDVIRGAPAVAEGAKKLWGAVSRSPQAPPAATTPPADPATPEGRMAALEAAVAEQHAQLLASSGLIKALAEQNEQLIARLDAQRRSLRRLGGAALLALLLATVALALLWAR